MLCQVEAICQVLFGHVVGFASRNALPQQDQDFKWVSASHVGSIGGSSTAILCTMLALLAPFWDQLPPSGAHDDAMCRGETTPASPKTTPNYTSKTLSPMALEA